MRSIKNITRISLLALTLLLYTACSEKAEPYEETNDTLSNTYEQGSIQTH